VDEFVRHLKAEEAALLEKLEVVRKALAIYHPATNTAPAPEKATARALAELANHAVNAAASVRADKFSSYGQKIVATALELVPPYGKPPLATRTLVEMLTGRGVTVRGENPINALSALLARSSQLQAHGRRGWTRAELRPKENEPNSGSAVGSDAAEEGGTNTQSASGNPNSTGEIW
jgi:hypothetical protein